MDQVLELDNHNVLIHYTNVSEGNFHEKFESAKTVNRRTKKLVEKLGIDDSVLLVMPGGSKVYIEKTYPRVIKGYDSIILSDFSVSVLMRMADCPPLVLSGVKSGITAVIHCSRTGLQQDIVDRSIRKLKEIINDEPILVYLGPGIHFDSYILPSKIAKELTHSSWKNNLKFIDDGKKIKVNIFGFIQQELEENSLRIDVDDYSKVNTVADESYFSHYRATRHDEENGRNLFTVQVQQK